MLETRASQDHGVALVREVVADGGRPGVVERVIGEVVVNVDAEACGSTRAVEPSAVGLVVDTEHDDEAVADPRVFVVRAEQARVARLLEDVRVEDVEVITSEHANDVGHERAVCVRAHATSTQGAVSSVLQEERFSIMRQCCESNSRIRWSVPVELKDHTSPIKYGDCIFLNQSLSLSSHSLATCAMAFLKWSAVMKTPRPPTLAVSPPVRPQGGADALGKHGELCPSID